jgi:hypothetical protein
MVPAKITYAESLLPLAGMLKGREAHEMLLILNALFERVVVEGLDTPMEMQAGYALIEAAR